MDDGSTDGTSLALAAKQPKVTVLRGTGSLYWTGSVKLGIDYVLGICQKNDWLILANNDVVFSRGAIHKLIDEAVNKERRAIISSLSVDVTDRDTIIKSGTLVKSWLLNRTEHIFAGQSYRKLKSNDLFEANLLTGRCLAHPVEIFGKIGNYDADRFPHYGGDDEFSARAKRMGYQLYVAPSSIVYLDTKTTGDNSNLLASGFSAIPNRLFGIKSNINLVTKWKFTLAVVPFYAIPSYYLIAVLKSIYVLLRPK